MKGCVLLSTYNGALYLETQLHSLLNQQGVEFDIIVRDDGSTDGTQDILKKWSDAGKIRWYSGENIGWAMSFMHLLVNAPEYEYYAFCDQDDIWKPNKIQSALKILDKAQTKPSCYFSNLTYWKEGVPLRNVYDHSLVFNKYTCLIQCPAYGCTMVINKHLAEIIRNNPPRTVDAHDFWVFQVATLIGEIHYDENSYILYRQHDNNQEGALRTSKETWRRRIHKNLPRLLKKRPIEENALELIRCYGQYATTETLSIMAGIAHYRESISAYFKLLFSTHYVMQKLENTFWLKLKILLGRL